MLNLLARQVLTTLKSEKGGTAVVNVIKKSGIEARLMDFFPPNNQVRGDHAEFAFRNVPTFFFVLQQQTDENFAKTFLARELPEVVSFRKAQAGQNAKKVRFPTLSVLLFQRPDRTVLTGAAGPGPRVDRGGTPGQGDHRQGEGVHGQEPGHPGAGRHRHGECEPDQPKQLALPYVIRFKINPSSIEPGSKA